MTERRRPHAGMNYNCACLIKQTDCIGYLTIRQGRLLRPHLIEEELLEHLLQRCLTCSFKVISS